MLHCKEDLAAPSSSMIWCILLRRATPNVKFPVHPSSLSSFSLMWTLPIQSPEHSRFVLILLKKPKTNLKTALCYRDTTGSPSWQPIYLQSKGRANQVSRAGTGHARQLLLTNTKHLQPCETAAIPPQLHTQTVPWMSGPPISSLFLQVGTDDLRSANIKELSRQQAPRDA